MKRIVIIYLLLLGVVGWTQSKPETFKFAERADWGDLKLDFYRSAQQRTDKACVVLVYGGGFVSGSRDEEHIVHLARALTDRGFAVACMDYRLGLKDSALVARCKGLSGMKTLFQTSIDYAAEDCAAATAWVIAHAKELDIDPQKIVLSGGSAGAIAVLQMDWARCNSLPLAKSLPQGWAPMAVIPYAGAIMCPVSKLHYATPPAPTFFLHGMKDKVVNYRRYPMLLSPSLNGSDRIVREFEKKGYPYWILRYKGIGHEVASFQMGTLDMFCAFVDQVAHGRQTFMDAIVRDSKLKPTEWTEMSVRDLYEK